MAGNGLQTGSHGLLAASNRLFADVNGLFADNNRLLARANGLFTVANRLETGSNGLETLTDGLGGYGNGLGGRSISKSLLLPIIFMLLPIVSRSFKIIFVLIIIVGWIGSRIGIPFIVAERSLKRGGRMRQLVG
jgi:hypothetical protein